MFLRSYLNKKILINQFVLGSGYNGSYGKLFIILNILIVNL